VIDRLVICGGNSDVVGRYVAPGLAHLRAAGLLPDGFTLVGVARADWDDERYREHLAEALDAHAPDVDGEARQALLEATRYHRADTTDAGELAGALELASADDGQAPVAVYLALPPAIFASTVAALDEIGLAEGSRIVLEKPFGEDLDDARELNAVLHRSFAEEAVHRVDHFLGMQTVQNLLALRFANRIFEPVWNCHHVERVDIVWDETLTLEGRAGYFDGTGALKDMLQNHLLQVLALMTMEAPASLDARELRSRKVQALREVRIMTRDEAAARSVRARYTAGRIGEREVPAYVDEDGVDPKQRTETLAEVTLAVDSWRWAGVPFRLRAGKALGADRREVVVRFRAVPHLAFEGVTAAPNELRIELEPEQLRLGLQVRAPGEEVALESIELSRDLAAPQVPAYGKVLLAVLEGDPVLSIRDDEAEVSWAIMMPVLDAWAAGEVELGEYEAGSDGP
jgi:glucose-6-phosphate 1-dehydrogenase